MIAWLAAMLALGSALLAKHVVALPAPAADRQLALELAPLLTSKDVGSWVAIHVLYAECRCSQRVVSELISTSTPHGWHEVMLWAGNKAPSDALQGRFRVVRVGSAELSQMGISSAPLLIVVDPQRRIRYVGGYTARKQGANLEYLRILAESRNGDRVVGLPVFGCAVSEKLRRQLSLFTGL